MVLGNYLSGANNPTQESRLLALCLGKFKINKSMGMSLALVQSANDPDDTWPEGWPPRGIQVCKYLPFLLEPQSQLVSLKSKGNISLLLDMILANKIIECYISF